MYNGVDHVRFEGIDDDQSFRLRGGRYAVTLVGQNFGTVTLSRLAVDGTTAVPVTASPWSANTYEILDLPAGDYVLTVNSTTDIFIDITGVAVPQ